MEQDIIKAFEKLRFYTLECIECVEEGNYKELDNLIMKRQEVLDFINQMNFTAEQCRKIAYQLDIVSLGEKLNNLILQERSMLKEKMSSIEKNKIAVNSYNSVLKGSMIFSKKI